VAWDDFNPKWFDVFNEEDNTKCGGDEKFKIDWKNKKQRAEFLRQYCETREKNVEVKKDFKESEREYEHLIRYDDNGKMYYERGKKWI